LRSRKDFLNDHDQAVGSEINILIWSAVILHLSKFLAHLNGYILQCLFIFETLPLVVVSKNCVLC
jgi:hypothetical protein